MINSRIVLVLLMLLVATTAFGQSPPDSMGASHGFTDQSPALRGAFGVRLGPSFLTNGDAKATGSAFYEVPIGSILLEPGLTLMTGGDGLTPLSEFNSMFAFDLRIGFPLRARYIDENRSELYASLGLQFMIWGDRADAAFPLSVNYDIPLSNVTQLDLGATIAPMIFLGGEKTQAYFGIFAGVRFPGPDEY